MSGTEAGLDHIVVEPCFRILVKQGFERAGVEANELMYTVRSRFATGIGMSIHEVVAKDPCVTGKPLEPEFVVVEACRFQEVGQDDRYIVMSKLGSLEWVAQCC